MVLLVLGRSRVWAECTWKQYFSSAPIGLFSFQACSLQKLFAVEEEFEDEVGKCWWSEVVLRCKHWVACTSLLLVDRYMFLSVRGWEVMRNVNNLLNCLRNKKPERWVASLSYLEIISALSWQLCHLADLIHLCGNILVVGKAVYVEPEPRKRQHSYWMAGGQGSAIGCVNQGRSLYSLVFRFLFYNMRDVLWL